MKEIIIQDTREHDSAIKKINKSFESHGYKVVRSKMYVGDYQFMSNPYFVVDRKKDLQELVGNVCQQHERFRRELIRANEAGIKLCILCEHGRGVTCLEDIKYWENPRLYKYPKAMKGSTLYYTLCTIKTKYNVDFKFCTKQETGDMIIDLLEDNKK